MKIIPLSLFFAGITLFSCSNESTNNLSTNSQKVKLNKNEVLSIAYDDAKELTDKDIFNVSIHTPTQGVTMVIMP